MSLHRDRTCSYIVHTMDLSQGCEFNRLDKWMDLIVYIVFLLIAYMLELIWHELSIFVDKLFFEYCNLYLKGKRYRGDLNCTYFFSLSIKDFLHIKSQPVHFCTFLSHILLSSSFFEEREKRERTITL